MDDAGNSIPVDVWWSEIFRKTKYTSLSKMVKAILSLFHGPIVEGSFSMMSDIIDKRSGRMQIDTYSAIQTVRYKLLSEKKSAVEFFHKKDFLHQPIDATLCRNLRSSRMNYQKELDEKKKEMDSKRNSQQTIQPMKKKIEEVYSAETATRLKHKRKWNLWCKRLKIRK